jgi:TPR repeat protein
MDALNYYKLAGEHGAEARIHCANGNPQAALKVALETSDPLACYHLARYYEGAGNMRESIVYYGKSQRIHKAISLAKEAGLDPEIYQMAMSSTSN